jgi:uncharacterized protein YqgV (UPF0045/DUF77 family)
MYRISKTTVDESSYELLCKTIYKITLRENIKKVIKNYTYNEYSTIIQYDGDDILQYIADNREALVTQAKRDEDVQTVTDKIDSYNAKLTKYSKKFVNLYQDYLDGNATETELNVLLKTISTLQSSIETQQTELTNL